MYQEFFGLRELPFELTPNPEFLFLTPQHREALSNLELAVQARKGVTVLTGDYGTGKSTIARALLQGLDRAGAYYAYVNNPTLKRDEFIELLANSFHLSSGAKMSKTALLKEMEEALRSRADAGGLTALVVDEAQSLSDELLEEVRLLVNIETESTKLLPVILIGHPSLAERLNQPQWRQLKQRVSLRCDLQPLDLNQTASYIVRRVKIAGGDCIGLFTKQAVMLIHERSGGTPRLINLLCDNALISAFALDRRPVTRAIALEVCRDFDLLGRAKPAVDPGTETESPAQVPTLVASSSFLRHTEDSDAAPPKEVPTRRFGFFF
jgi:general secretion pathway protein A